MKYILLIVLIIHTCQVDTYEYSQMGGQIYFPDITHEDMMQSIGPYLKQPYLEPTNSSFQNIVKGKQFGYGDRFFVSLPVRLSHPRCSTSINVIFKVDTGSKVTTLTKEAIQKLVDLCPPISHKQIFQFPVEINHRKIAVYESQLNYYNFNVLGANYMKANQIKLKASYDKFAPKITLIFDAYDGKTLE